MLVFETNPKSESSSGYSSSVESSLPRRRRVNRDYNRGYDRIYNRDYNRISLVPKKSNTLPRRHYSHVRLIH